MLIKIYPAFSTEESKRIQVESFEYKGITIYYKNEGYDVGFYAKILYPFGEVNELIMWLGDASLEKAIQKFKDLWDKTPYHNHDILRDKFIETYKECFYSPKLSSFGTVKCYEKALAVLGIPSQEWDIYYSKIQELRHAREIEKSAIAAAKKKADEELKLAKEAKEKARIESVKQDIVNGNKVGIEDLVQICETLGIVIPIRTKGGFFKRVTEVDNQSYRVRGGTTFKVSPISYYVQAQEKLSVKIV